MLAAKVDECTTPGIRAALQPGSGRVVDLGDEETAYSESIETEPGVEGYDTNGYSEFGMFDFGTLSEASMAWLGSMSDDTFGDIAGMNDPPLYQPG